MKASEILRMLKAQEYRCAMTGRELTPETASIDHKIPLSRGGEHAQGNAQIIDRMVNSAKGTMTVEEFVTLCRDVMAWHETQKPDDRTEIEVASEEETPGM